MADEKKPAAPVTVEFTEDGAKIGGQEYKLLPGATGQVLQKYAERVGEASEVFKVLLSAVGSIAGGQVQDGDLLERARDAVKAKNLASRECALLDGVFEAFFDKPGILGAFKDPKQASNFAGDVVLRFASRK